MMNVEFILDQSFFDLYTRTWSSVVSPSKLKPLVKATMGRFTGNGIVRKTCGVLLWAVEYENEDNNWLSSPMAMAIRHMTGFDQIIIEVEDQKVSLAHSRAVAESGEEEASVAGYETPADEDGIRGSQGVKTEGITNCTWAFTHQIRDAFEDKLGPGEVGGMVSRPGIATSLFLEFRPQKQNHGKGDEKKRKQRKIVLLQLGRKCRALNAEPLSGPSNADLAII